MKKHSVLFSRILTVLLTAFMFVGMMLPMTANAASKAKVQKKETRYEIAVVLDNSGSMYDTEAWCRAKYAMEIFASMLNYENGDKLTIFPMWESVYDGSAPTDPYAGSYAPLTISGGKGGTDSISQKIDSISRMYTTNPYGTPYESVTSAAAHLKTSKADEKWLIVLTDGEFDRNLRSDTNVDEFKGGFNLEKELLSLAVNNQIKVQYLGFDDAAELKTNEANGFYAVKSTDTSLKDDLVGICNKIFQRERLSTDECLNGKTLKLDLSMKKLIVFVQGNDAVINSLTDSSGKMISKIVDSGQRKYSDISCNFTGLGSKIQERITNQGLNAPPVDTTLAGQVVTFSECPKGEYTLDFSGDNNVQIFYEPDVDIKVELMDMNTKEIVDPSSGNIAAGTYKLTSTLVDAKTNEDVSGNKLLGGVDLKTYVKKSTDSAPTPYDNGAEITFEPDSKTEVYIEGTFLKNYSVSTKDNPNAFPLSIKFSDSKLSISLEPKVLQEQSWYRVKDHEKWKPVEVTVLIGGQPATKEQMANVKLNVTPSGNLAYRVETADTESKYRIYIGCDDKGNFVEPAVGKYSLSFEGTTYTDEIGDEHTANKKDVSFEINTYSRFWRWLVWIIAIAVILIVWLAFMRQKVMPNKIIKDSASFWSISAGDLDINFVSVKYNRKQRVLVLEGPSAIPFKQQISVTFKLKPVDNRFTKANKRRTAVIGISSSADEINIGATTYVKYNGQWMKESFVESAEQGRPSPPIEKVLSVGPSFEVYNSPNGANVSNLICNCRTKK